LSAFIVYSFIAIITLSFCDCNNPIRTAHYTQPGNFDKLYKYRTWKCVWRGDVSMINWWC